MPSNLPISFATTGPPGGASYCPDSWSALFLNLAASLYGYVPGQYSFFVMSETEPAAEDRDKPWLQLDGSGAPVAWFKYYAGAWVWPNPIEPSSIVRWIAEGTDADIWSFDGGDGTDPSTNPPTDTTGAMWEVDANYDGRMPIGSGTLSPSGTTVNVGDTGGADQVTQTEAQMARHSHALAYVKTNANSQTTGLGTIASEQSVYDTYEAAGKVDVNGDASAIQETGGSGSPETTQPMTTISPYRGCRIIKRTARIFRTP